MNVIQGDIEAIEIKGSLSLVKVKASDLILSSIVIDTPATASYLEVGKRINVIFKETEVIIATDVSGQISLQNQIPAEVLSVENGDLLGKILLTSDIGQITSIITRNAISQLKLQAGSKVVAMVKTNEVMLSE